MTYRTDPYDPKQPALLAPEELEDAVAAAEKAFAGASDPDALAAIRHQHLGDRAPVSLARREIGALPPAARADAGKRVNAARTAIQAAYDARAAVLQAQQEQRVLAEERVDVTLPVDRRPRGARHPLSALMERIEDLFVGMGYEVAEGPEAELEWYNFDALNIGRDHPARTMMDTFYVAAANASAGESGLVLRTHTSPVQARALLSRQLPVYVICPGRVYRTDELDATPARCSTRWRGWWWIEASPWHLWDAGPLARAMFGPQADPAAASCSRSLGRRPMDLVPQHGKVDGQMGGCGVVNPAQVGCGVDPESSDSPSMGIERTLMFRQGDRHARHGGGRRPVRAAFRMEVEIRSVSWLRASTSTRRPTRRRWGRRWSVGLSRGDRRRPPMTARWCWVSAEVGELTGRKKPILCQVDGAGRAWHHLRATNYTASDLV